MNRLQELHETLATRGAKAVVQNLGARDYGLEKAHPALFTRVAAKTIELFVDVPRSSSEIYKDVVRDMASQYPAYVLPSDMEPETPPEAPPIVAS